MFVDPDDQPDKELEDAMRVSEIARRHGLEIHGVFSSGEPVSIEFAEELVRCAIEEALGEGRQLPKEFDPLLDHFRFI